MDRGTAWNSVPPRSMRCHCASIGVIWVPCWRYRAGESITFGNSEPADRADGMDDMPDEEDIEQEETVSMTWAIV